MRCGFAVVLAFQFPIRDWRLFSVGPARWHIRSRSSLLRELTSISTGRPLPEQGLRRARGSAGTPSKRALVEPAPPPLVAPGVDAACGRSRERLQTLALHEIEELQCGAARLVFA